MLAVDDILDDAHWVNVQDPIKQMFLSITKALRVQASSLRELDRKCSDFVTRDFVRNQIHSVEDTVCNKQDATQIIYQLQQKVDQKDYGSLQTRYEQMSQYTDRLQTTIHDQSLEIQSLHTHIEHLQKEIEVLKNPSYDQIFAYIDRQVHNVTDDFERKLSIKADKREMETVIPQRLEDLYRNLNNKYHEIKLEVSKAATKEEMIAVGQSKADKSEVRDLAADLHDKMSRADSAHLLGQQTKPLYTALAAMEKAQHAQDQRLLTQLQELQERSISWQRQHQDHMNMYHSPQTGPAQEKMTAEKVTSIVHEYLRDRKLEDLSRVHLDGMFSHHTDYLLKQVGILGESIRLEIVSSNREEMNILKQQYEASLRDNVSQTKEISEKHSKTRQALKELSTNVSKALSKKVDVADYRKFLQKVEAIEQLEEDIHHVRRGRLSSSAAMSAINASSSSAKLKRNVVSSNDPNETFDILIQSLKSGASSSSEEKTRANNRSPEEEDAAVYASDEEQLPSSPLKFSRSTGSAAAIAASGGLRSKSPASASSRFQRGTSRSPSKRVGGGGGVSTSLLSASATAVNTLQDEIVRLQGQLQHVQKKMVDVSSLSVGQQEVERLDWRIAMGDLSMQLRRELAEKAARDEMLSLVQDEVSLINQRLKPMEQVVDKEWSKFRQEVPQDISRLQQEVIAIKQRVSSEIQGARFLWTSGQLTALTSTVPSNHNSNYLSQQCCWIPWDRQVFNASPQIILWRKNGPTVTVKIPGLYLFTVSTFTTNTAVAHKIIVYLNDEPLLMLQTAAQSPSVTRYRHSLGDVSSFSLEEYVSLPPEARLSVCLLPQSTKVSNDGQASSPSSSVQWTDDSAGALPQAFFALRKL